MTPRVLFILGNHNTSTMLHKIAEQLPECERWFTPYYSNAFGFVDILRRLRLLEFAIVGCEYRRRVLRYCAEHDLPVDLGGRRNHYDLIVTCSDVVVPANVAGTPLIGVQEGMIDPPLFWYRMLGRLPFLPRWAAGTACTGLSGRYVRYCVASDGYRDDFIARGAPADRLVVTGVPNLDSFRSHVRPGHWIEGHVLACTSDGRECLRRDDRRDFIRWCLDIAGGRPLVFKFHPNERMSRAVAEVRRWAPGARVVTEGYGEELAANCAELVTEWSTLAYVGLALGVPTHSYRDLERHRAMIPLQHGRGAANVAEVCREVLAENGRRLLRAA
jgi:hypothetical protein